MKKDELNNIMIWEDAILSLIDNRDKLTRSDLQAAVGAIVLQIMNKRV